MKKKVLVSLVSDQAIPNVEFINEFKSKIDSYIFITTEYMESDKKNRTKCILSAAHLTKINVKRIIVKEDSLSDIQNKLSGEINDESEYIVNLTGGTKIMSIAVYQFFKNINANIYYKPIRSNKIISVEDDSLFREITTKISVTDYLLSYGVNSRSSKTFQNRNITDKIFAEFINGTIDYQILEVLRVYYRNKKNKYKISDISNNTNSEKRISNLFIFLLNLGFDVDDSNNAIITKSEIAYLTGGWYEELCYYYFKEQLVLEDSAIQLGVKLEKSNTVLDNDLDVVFVYNNIIYVIECKTAMAKNGKVSTALFNETIYKASALRAKFGLTVKNMLLTLSSMKHPNIVYEERAEVMNIDLYGRKYFDGEILLDKLINKIKISY